MVNPAAYIKGKAISTNVPASTGGMVTAYHVSPSLPVGLSLDPSTGLITGTPTAVSALADFAVTATNAGGTTTATLKITINDVAPSGLNYPSPIAVYTVGSAITANTPTNTGGAAMLYAVSPTLPAGLTINTSTGLIGGMPTAVTAMATYTVTATNSGGDTKASLTITVNDVAPNGLTYTANPPFYTKGLAIAAITPSSTGGA